MGEIELRKAIAIWLCIMMVISAFMISANIGNYAEGKESEGNQLMYISHMPIRINSNAQFDAAHGVTSGNGTQANPFIIENYEINGAGFGYCIYIGNTTNYFTVRNCNLHHASGVSTYPYFYDSGLILYNVQNGMIINNTALNNKYGLEIWSSSHNTIVNNTALTNSQAGIILYSSGNNNLLHNNFSNNLGFGMNVGTSSNANNITGNTANSNINVGIMICWNSVSNTVNNNNASLNSNGGIFVSEYANSNIFVNNKLYLNNGLGGFYLQRSSSNKIYHNNLIGNNVQAYADSANTWDNGYPSGGNYWGNYAGVDGNGDGIGDTPYSFSGGQDRYPLKHPTVERPMLLISGWNLISFPMEQPTINGMVIRRASDLANQTSPAMISKWNPLNQSYLNFIPGFHLSTDPENFLIGPDDAVFIFTSSAGTCSIFGYVSTALRSVNLQPGWNLLGYHSMDTGNVEADWAGQVSCGLQDDICYWDGTTFKHYIFAGTVMELTPGRGYFVWSDTATTLTY
jgi:parallel beta-helix repeat protein